MAKELDKSKDTGASSGSQARLQILSRHLKNNQDGIFGVGIHRTQDYRQRHNIQKVEVFRYTCESKINKLPRREREFYEENGYIMVKNLIPLDLLQNLQQRFQDVIEGKIELPGAAAITECLGEGGAGTWRSIHDFFADDILFQYCKFPQLLDYVENFCGPNIVAMKAVMTSIAPEDAGRIFAKHELRQDLEEIPFHPNNHIVCSWTAVESMTREEGCLAVIPGTHKEEIQEWIASKSYCPFWENEENSAPSNVNGIPTKKVYLELGAGDTVFFHPLLFKGLGANRSTRSRKIISCHFVASECEYDKSATKENRTTSKANVPRGILDQFIAKNTGATLSHPSKDIWTFQGQLVRGNRIKL